MMKWRVTQVCRCSSNREDVGFRFHERLAYRIDALIQGEFQAVMVVIGKGGDAKVDSRQVESFAGPQLTADNDPACDLILLHDGRLPSE